jgi:formiminoglutamase
MIEDIRIGSLWEDRKIGWEESQLVIINFPSDEGVRRNAGRVGAAQAPEQILRFFRRLCPDPRDFKAHRSILESIYCVELNTGEDLESDQHILAEEVAKALGADKIPIVLGGGHETSYGHFLGYVEAHMPVSIINWDAHPDVRPSKEGLGHSGSPFRQAAEHLSGILKHYSVWGLQPQSVALEHLEYLRNKGYEYIWASELSLNRVEEIMTATDHNTMMTIDLDVIDQSQAPGVSAPNADGLRSDMLYRVAYLGGRNPSIRSFDIVEMNPLYDRDLQTARLAALILWNITLGIAQRS